MADKRPNLKICIDNTEEQSDSESSSSGSESDSESGSSSSSSSGSSSSSSSSDSGSSDSESEDSGKDERASVGKIEDVEDLGVREQPRKKHKKQEPKRYENKSGEFVTGFDPLSEEAQTRRLKRAKRFGIQTNIESIDKKDVKELYSSLGIKERDLSEPGEKGIQIEALYIRGVDEMSKDDIFDYFKEFPAGSVDFLDASSCTIVWRDPVTAARALLQLSRSRLKVETEFLDDTSKKLKEKLTSVSKQGDVDVDMQEKDKPEEKEINKDIEPAEKTESQEQRKAESQKESDEDSWESVTDESEDDDDDDLNLLSSDDEAMIKKKEEKKVKKKVRRKKKKVPTATLR